MCLNCRYGKANGGDKNNFGNKWSKTVMMQMRGAKKKVEG